MFCHGWLHLSLQQGLEVFHVYLWRKHKSIKMRDFYEELVDDVIHGVFLIDCASSPVI